MPSEDSVGVGQKLKFSVYVQGVAMGLFLGAAAVFATGEVGFFGAVSIAMILVAVGHRMTMSVKRGGFDVE